MYRVGQNARVSHSGGGSSKFLRGTGTNNFDLRGLPPRKLIGFGPFVFCLWTILRLCFIFLSFSLVFSIVFLPSRNFRGDVPPLEILGRGHVPPSSPASAECGIASAFCMFLKEIHLFYLSSHD